MQRMPSLASARKPRLLAATRSRWRPSTAELEPWRGLTGLAPSIAEILDAEAYGMQHYCDPREQVAALSALHVVASVNPGTGGPAMSVPGLAGALIDAGVSCSIASLDYSEFGKAVHVSGARNICVQFGRLGRLMRGVSRDLSRAIAVESARVDVVHHHGLWMAPGIYARRAAKAAGIPLIISPRGMLDTWSLGRSGLQKRLAAMAYESRNLRAAALFHATSQLEVEAIRRYGLRQPIAMVPNGIELPDGERVPGREVLEEAFPETRDKRWLLFMGRIDPKKGLDMLLMAWKILHARFPQWQLVIAGPDLVGMRSELVRMLEEGAVPQDSVVFTGMLEGQSKRSALRNAELVILPTRSENFGMVVCEALAWGTPVITTTAAPWQELVSEECGWWVAPQLDSIVEALACALAASARDLEMMGQRGQDLVARRYTWRSVGARMALVYRWLVTGGPAPESIQMV